MLLAGVSVYETDIFFHCYLVVLFELQKKKLAFTALSRQNIILSLPRLDGGFLHHSGAPLRGH